MDTAALVVDEVYVISDLHLGGEAPFQIFREGPALAAWVDSLGQAPAGAARRALVINGDFIDFLAERPARHFDAEAAVSKLRRIAGDSAFAPVFAALGRFLAVPAHRLAVVLGNHDVELALVWVRQALEHLLCGEDDARRGRMVWALEGQGVLLRMGNASGPRVMCVHGNEVDPWNVVNHEDIRRLSRDGLRDHGELSDYVPNAGSRMVIEVMNGIKQRYPFVDLLKPETQAVIPTLLALDPAAAAALRALPALVARQQSDRLRIATGFLGDASPGSDATSAPELAGQWHPLPAPLRQASRTGASLALLDAAEAGFREDRHPLDLLDASARSQTLGLGSALLTLLSGGDRVEALRAQLKELADDRSFSTLDRDPTFVAMHERVSTNIDFLVTGHTHLARAIEREFKRAYYFNTGTWARVFRIAPQALRDRAAFAQLFDALGRNSLDALDAADGLVAVRPHLAAFWCDAQGVHGELREVEAQPPYRAVPVAGTRYTRG